MRDHPLQLSRRERQIMEIIYSLGEASASQVLEAMTDPPSRTAVRTFLRILEQKGHLTHRAEDRHYVYRPTRPAGQVARSMFRRMLQTFFGGSLEQAVAAHLSDPDAELSPQELQRLQKLINQARKKEN
jgi:BlaI family transcriptional regulator, penicillinase repressor